MTAKFDKYVAAGLLRKEVVIFIRDGDGNKKTVESELNTKKTSDVKDKQKDKIKFIIFDFEIEEWIIKSKGLKIKSSCKPSTLLKGYKKYKLPDFADSIDLDMLPKIDKNFKEFLTLLDP